MGLGLGLGLGLVLVSGLVLVLVSGRVHVPCCDGRVHRVFSSDETAVGLLLVVAHLG